MDFPALRSHLTVEATKLAAAVDGKLTAPVPTCPEWTSSDLVHHVAEVYEHKVQCMRLQAEPEPWPPPVGDAAPLTRLRTALGDLLAEFTERSPQDPAYTWYEPDQTVGFWIRRMAQETFIHRIDAELAATGEHTDVDAEAAVDGIDELLQIFVAWSSRQYLDQLAEPLAAAAHRPVGIVAGAHTWRIQTGTEGITVAAGNADDVDATVSGDPDAILLWLWRRVPYDAVASTGDTAAAKELYELLRLFTQ